MFNIRKLTFCGVLAGLYVVLTVAMSSVAYGPIQLRLAEGLTVIPFFMPFAAAGLFMGCMAANIFSSYGLPDIIFGSLATLAAGILTSLAGRNFRRRLKETRTANIKITEYILAPLPPVLVNAVVIAAVITFSVQGSSGLAEIFVTNFISLLLSQTLNCYLFGVPLMVMLSRRVRSHRL